MSVRLLPSIPKQVWDQLFAVDPAQKVIALMHIFSGRESLEDCTVSATLLIKNKAGKAGKVIYEQPLHESTKLIAKQMDVATLSTIWDTAREKKMMDGHFTSTAQVTEAQCHFEHVVYTDKAVGGGWKVFFDAKAQDDSQDSHLNKDTKQKDWGKGKSVLVCISNHHVTVHRNRMLEPGSTDFSTLTEMYKNCAKFKQMMDLCAQQKVPLKMQSEKGDIVIDGLFSSAS